MDNNKYVDNFKSQYATRSSTQNYREKIDRELQIRSQKRRDKKALRENVDSDAQMERVKIEERVNVNLNEE